ncbi:histone deacetylase 4-like, partial [Hemiscyllium ocellatum]|uniref:histone deacetylase 4-like n=1 Tax=Hemiscyllium ocellatum TaxID=170820 RepID=UPI00296693C3
MAPHPEVRATYDHIWNPTLGAALGHHPLRKTASEPNLKLRPKLRSSERRRRSPLVVRRKASAPAGLRGATADGGASLYYSLISLAPSDRNILSQ